MPTCYDGFFLIPYSMISMRTYDVYGPAMPEIKIFYSILSISIVSCCYLRFLFRNRADPDGLGYDAEAVSMGCCGADRRRVHAGEGLHGMFLLFASYRFVTSSYESMIITQW